MLPRFPTDVDGAVTGVVVRTRRMVEVRDTAASRTTTSGALRPGCRACAAVAPAEPGQRHGRPVPERLIPRDRRLQMARGSFRIAGSERGDPECVLDRPDASHAEAGHGREPCVGQQQSVGGRRRLGSSRSADASTTPQSVVSQELDLGSSARSRPPSRARAPLACRRSPACAAATACAATNTLSIALSVGEVANSAIESAGCPARPWYHLITNIWPPNHPGVLVTRGLAVPHALHGELLGFSPPPRTDASPTAHSVRSTASDTACTSSSANGATRITPPQSTTPYG